MCEILVGLPEVNVLGIEERQGSLEIHVECRTSRPGCPKCGVLAHLKDQRIVTLVDLPCFGRCTRLLWHKRRWRCPDPDCANGSWTEEDDRIAAPRLAMTDRAGRWVTAQVGRCRAQRERGGQASSAVTGTRSTTPSSPMAEPWSITQTASAPSRLSDSTKC